MNRKLRESSRSKMEMRDTKFLIKNGNNSNQSPTRPQSKDTSFAWTDVDRTECTQTMISTIP
jgi:ribosomal protein S17